jgi:hypothetical protein
VDIGIYVNVSGKKVNNWALVRPIALIPIA